MALFPKDTNFYDLFERGAAKVHEGVQLLEDLVKNFINVPLKAKRIKDVEHEADLITHETVAKLNKTFVTPLDREDIHNLISSLDNILDHVEAAADRWRRGRDRQGRYAGSHRPRSRAGSPRCRR